MILMEETNMPNNIDPMLIIFGRSNCEIDIGVPDEVGQLEDFHIHLQYIKLVEEASS
jgi:SpoVK/Ycf46/Vps4 family AAA+-type ATPase